MPTLVTYDLQQNHSEFKKQLFLKAFYNCVRVTGTLRKMPNTTVLHPSTDLNIVQAEFNEALKATSNPGLEKVAYVPFTDTWILSSNETCKE